MGTRRQKKYSSPILIDLPVCVIWTIHFLWGPPYLFFSMSVSTHSSPLHVVLPSFWRKTLGGFSVLDDSKAKTKEMCSHIVGLGNMIEVLIRMITLIPNKQNRMWSFASKVHVVISHHILFLIFRLLAENLDFFSTWRLFPISQYNFYFKIFKLYSLFKYFLKFLQIKLLYGRTFPTVFLVFNEIKKFDPQQLTLKTKSESSLWRPFPGGCFLWSSIL